MALEDLLTQVVPNRGAKIRVAAADSQPRYLREIRRILSSQPDVKLVAEVSNADEIPPMLQRQRPDILLIELDLFLAAGLSILREVRETYWVRSRIIILTGSDNERDRVHAIKCGAVGLLPKNCGGETLLRCIRKVHAGEIWVDARTTAPLVRALQTSQPQSAPKIDAGLSKREREVVKLVAQGLRSAEIAAKLSVRHGTVKQHLHNIYTKLGLETRTGLAVYAVQQGWASHESISPAGDRKDAPQGGSGEFEEGSGGGTRGAG